MHLAPRLPLPLLGTGAPPTAGFPAQAAASRWVPGAALSPTLVSTGELWGARVCPTGEPAGRPRMA